MAWVAAILFLLGIGLRAVLPTLVERAVAGGSRHFLGLPARIGNVDFSFWNGSLVLEDVSVGALPDGVPFSQAVLRPPDGGSDPPLLHCERLDLRWSWSGLFQKKLRLRELTVTGLSLRVLREADGTLDPLRHAKPLARPSPPQTPSSQTASEPWPVEIGRFTLLQPSLMLVDASHGKPLLEFSLESFEVSDAAVHGDDVGFGAVAIRAPVLRVQHELALTTPPVGAQADSAKDAPPSANPGFRIQKIDMERAKFTWLGQEGSVDVLLTLRASSITAEQGKRFPIDLALQIGSGTIGLVGDAGILPPFYKGRVTWEGISLPPVLLAAQPDMAAWLRTAETSGKMELRADPAGVQGPSSLRLSGQMALSGLAIADPGGKEVFFGWKSLDIVMKDLTVPLPEEGKPPRTIKAALERISLAEPVIRYTNPSPSLQAFGADAGTQIPASAPSGSPSHSPPEPTAAQNSSPNPMELSVALFELSGGKMEVRDTLTSTTTTLSDVAVKTRDIRFPQQTFSALSLLATLPTQSQLSVEGHLESGQTGEFSITLQDLDLPAFSSYAQGAGVALESGKFSLKSRLKTRGKVIHAENEIVLNKLAVSLSDPDWFAREFGVPLNLALALLRDHAGDIRLAIPVRSDEQGTTISVGTLIGSALKAAILGAITSPLKLVGAVFGESDRPGTPSAQPGGAARGIAGVSAAPIKSLPGSADMDPKATAQIGSFAKLLTQHPDMKIVLRGRIGAEDRPILAEDILREHVQAGQKMPEVSDSGFLARRRIHQYLIRRARGKTAALEEKDRSLFERYLAAVEIPEERLNALARQRAERVRDQLVAKGARPGSLSVESRGADGEPGVEVIFR